MLQEFSQPNVTSVGRSFFPTWKFWLLLIGTGIGTGLGGGLLMMLLRAVEHLSWSYQNGDFLSAVERTSWQQRLTVLCLAGILTGVVRWLLKHQPGGHAGEIAEALWFGSGQLPLGRTVVRAVLSIVIVGMGASLGREAAPKQVGGVIGSLLSQAGKLSPTERRLLVACGAGAGIGAVYNVPLGGALFATEVLLGTVALPLIIPAVTTSLIATWVSWLFLPNAPTYLIPRYELTQGQIIWALVTGPITGLVAVLYIRTISWADARKPKGWRLFVIPLAVFAVLGALAVPFPQLLGNGKDVVQRIFVDQLGLSLSITLLLLKPLVTAACLGSGAPGGLFTPTLTCGALLGETLGKFGHVLWPKMPIGSCGLIAGGALLAATMQAPISSVVLIVELTHRADSFMVPLLLATAGAVLIAGRVEPRSIYTVRIHTGRAAATAELGQSSIAFRRYLTDDYGLVSAAAHYPEVLQEMNQHSNSARSVYVLDEQGHLQGFIPPATIRTNSPPAALRTIATAGDLARSITPLQSSFSEPEAADRLRQSLDEELPVSDMNTGRFIGVAKLP